MWLQTEQYYTKIEWDFRHKNAVFIDSVTSDIFFIILWL